MAKKKNKRKSKKVKKKEKKGKMFDLSFSPETERQVLALLFFLSGITASLSFFGKAGLVGIFFFQGTSFLLGKTVFLFPFLFFLSGWVLLKGKYNNLLRPLFLAILLFIFGFSGILEAFKPGIREGGWLGEALNWPLLRLFGVLVSRLIFSVTTVIGGLIFWRLSRSSSSQPSPKTKENNKKSFIKKIFKSSFKVQKVEPDIPPPVKEETKKAEPPVFKLKRKPISDAFPEEEYQMPPLKLLDSEEGEASPGNIRANSAIIKKTLESFDIPVEISGVNIGPTVSQYCLKPAEGIKLSRITSLSNDLSLALATHPIRIEAPIPGKSLVGIEVPNNIRSFVRLKELIQDPQFKKSPSNLTFCLGKDVSGDPYYADLGRMPHLLVAGSTGSGKTIFLNSLILSLIYRNPPKILRFILVDPKRVEFPVYNNLPHLLCPAVVDAPQAINVLKWLIQEMERRFEILAEVKSRNILSYNKKASKNGKEYLPYIVLVIDELADLMAAKGKEVEDTIVRLAQMARAVGIHLVVATQRPSVEVITGLIKANITSRLSFQVASQVDSRTVLDMAGAEKLLGSGDMLFISSEIVKPRRIQGVYVAESEVKKVVNWMSSQFEESQEEGISPVESSLEEELADVLEGEAEIFDEGSSQEDPLYGEAKAIVVQTQKGSASLLQRKLRVGYPRAARLIDLLEKKGVVGPSRGTKARRVYLSQEEEEGVEEEEGGWQKV